MIEECLEFLSSIKDYSDLLINRAKLRCLLKITIFVKKDIIFHYPLVINHLIDLCKELSGFLLFFLFFSHYFTIRKKREIEP